LVTQANSLYQREGALQSTTGTCFQTGNNMKTKTLVILLISAVAMGASSLTMAGGVHVGVNIGIPVPVYAAPAPVYVAPAPVYAPPPPPVVYEPTPVTAVPAIYIGWHGDRYWGRRDWNRNHGGNGHRH
jgi:hypothetical protein